jgi:hypothetical protein
MSALTQEQQDVIKKVQKLLALAGNNPNEHEAEAATAKAMDLLSAYNLSMHAIHSTANTSAKRDDKKKKGGLYGWQRELWKAVSELNFCMYWAIKGLTAGSTYEHRILGSEVNVISTEVMAEYLQQAIERRAQTWAKENHYKSVFVREAIAYREGMAHTICGRLQELRRQRLDEERAKSASNPNRGNGTDLVLMDVIETEEDLNNDYINGWEPGTSAARRAKRKAEQAAAQESARKYWEEREEWERNNPEEAASDAKYRAKEARRMKNAGKPGYDDLGYKIRYRNMTAEEHRRSLSSFGEGRREGEKISLNKQASTENRKGIK